ncbi:MAG: ABC transporter substrate-binding protein [Patescibacteria group bacterium]|nr:hypothetical protein [Patescibacteria group bacterium]
MSFNARISSKIKQNYQLAAAFVKKLTESLATKERIILVSLLFCFLSSLAWTLANTFLKKTTIVPAVGGTFIEGIVGKPEYINPVLAQGNEADMDLAQLIFSGLMKYDQNNQLINDIASGWEINEDKTQYTINLKENVLFHDGTRLTAEDVLFTINTIQNTRYKSPLRPNWAGVEVRSNGDTQIIFTLKKPFVPFLHNLTFGILPKHIWQDVTPEEFQISEYNKSPIGAGPYQFNRLEKEKDKSISQIILKANKHYYLDKPYIETILVKFFPSQEKAVQSLNSGEIMAVNDLSHHNLETIDTRKTNINEISLPRYYAIFLNIYQNEFIADDNVRQALAWATCKDQIISDILLDRGKQVDSPVLTIPMDNVADFEKRGCSREKAREILEKQGWKLKDWTPENDQQAEEPEENTENSSQEQAREEEIPARQVYYNKSKEPLALTLTTADYPELVKTAELVKQQWEEAGILVTLEVLSIGDLTNSKIEPREYDALLFGETLGVDPDPRPYWHSSERKSPGQNIVSYNNSQADELLDQGRTEENEEVRNQLYQKFQLLINQDIPAIFLYSPYYLYPVNRKVMGITLKNIGDPSKRYSQITNWYLEEKRAKK